MNTKSGFSKVHSSSYSADLYVTSNGMKCKNIGEQRLIQVSIVAGSLIKVIL